RGFDCSCGNEGEGTAGDYKRQLARLSPITAPAVLAFSSRALAAVSSAPLGNAAVYVRPGEFRHSLHPIHNGSYSVAPIFADMVLHALHGCVAAYPLRRIARDLFRQDHHDVDRTTFADAGSAFQENAGFAEVEGLGRDVPVFGMHLGRNLHRFTRCAPLFGTR